MTFIELKIKMIKKKIKFIDLVKLDGRSYQYLHRECKSENAKVIDKLNDILEKI